MSPAARAYSTTAPARGPFPTVTVNSVLSRRGASTAITATAALRAAAAPTATVPACDLKIQRRIARRRYDAARDAEEKLLLCCILKAQIEQGTKPLAQLRLPPSIGVVVDYDIVKRLFYAQELREDDADEAGRMRHRIAAKQALGRARRSLMRTGIIGCRDPFIWWTGKPVRGIKETQRHDPSLFK
ncbi:putative GNAT family acetyltransferase [Nitrobacteraceae bacterium AZCC 2146]